MKPLSEQEWREKIIDLVYDAIEYGEELHTGHVKTDKEIKKDFGKLLSTVDSIVDLILSDRQAWGEYVIGTSSLSMVMSPAIRLKNGHIDTSWTDEHDKYKAAYIEDGLRAEQRQRNQGEKK